MWQINQIDFIKFTTALSQHIMETLCCWTIFSFSYSGNSLVKHIAKWKRRLACFCCCCCCIDWDFKWSFTIKSFMYKLDLTLSIAHMNELIAMAHVVVLLLANSSIRITDKSLVNRIVNVKGAYQVFFSSSFVFYIRLYLICCLSPP